MICNINYRIKIIKFILIIAICIHNSNCLINVKKSINHPVTINARINWGENSIFSSNILLDANDSDTLGYIKNRITNLTGIPVLSQRIYLIKNGTIDYNFGPINNNITLKSICSNQMKTSNTNVKPHIELQLDIGAPYLASNKLLNTSNLHNLTPNNTEELNKLYDQLAELLASQYKIDKLLERSNYIKRNWSSFRNLSLDKLTEAISFPELNTHHSNLNDFNSIKDKVLTTIKPMPRIDVEIDEIVPLELNIFQDYPRHSHNVMNKIKEYIIFNLPISYPALIKFTIISQLLRMTGQYPDNFNLFLRISPLLFILLHTRQGSFATKILLKMMPYKYIPKVYLNVFPAPTIKSIM